MEGTYDAALERRSSCMRFTLSNLLLIPIRLSEI
jgi:hypothetical protein